MKRPAVLHVLPETGPHVNLVAATSATRAICVQATSGAGALLVAACRHRVALVHAHSPAVAAAVTRLAATLHRPWVLSLPAGAPEDAVRGWRPDLWVVTSEADGALLVGSGVDPCRVRVVPEGVALPDASTGPDPDPPLVLVDGADPPAAAQLAAALEARGVATAVVPPGHRLTLASVGVSLGGDAPDASRRFLLQAQACGVPVVAADDPTLDDVLAPGAPRVATDAPAMVQAILALLAGRVQRDQLRQDGRRQVTLRHELGARAADLDEQYVSLVRRSEPAPQRHPASEWPTVSVVIATRNRRDLLRRTLEALCAQSYPDERVQIVVVDDASRDGTSQMLADVDPPWRLTALRSDRNLAAGARNRALAVCDGEVVAFTDDDCRPCPTWLESLVGGLVDGVDVVQGRTVADPDQPLTPLSRTQWTPAEYGLYETANIAYRRGALNRLGDAPFSSDLTQELVRVFGQRIGGFPFGEDTDLAWRVKRTGSATRFSSTAVVHHHVYDPDLGYLFRRALLTAGFPLLLRRVPELRAAFLWRRVFLGSRHGAFVLAVAGGVATRRRPALAATLAVPYLWSTLRPLRAGRRVRLRAAPVLVARDVVEVVALLVGSAIARKPVL